MRLKDLTAKELNDIITICYVNFFSTQQSGFWTLSGLPLARLCFSSKIFEQRRDCSQSKQQFSIAYRVFNRVSPDLNYHKGDR